MPWRNLVNLCEQLKESIILDLHRQYEFINDRNILARIRIAYNGLFELLFDQISPSKELHVFTTNYDSVIENYCVNTGLMLNCGFQVENRTYRQFWHPKLLGKSCKGKCIKLYKLHGSLDWRETNDNRIERVSTEEPVSETTRRYRRNMLIYPARKSYAAEEPFSTLMRYFRDVLFKHKACLIIGFSFRDPDINRILTDFLKKDSRHKLLIVSPSASKDLEDNLRLSKALKKQAICVNKPFGEKETLLEIQNILATQTKL